MFDYSYDSRAEVFEHQFSQEETERLGSLRNSGYGPAEALVAVLSDRRPGLEDDLEVVSSRYAQKSAADEPKHWIHLSANRSLGVLTLRYTGSSLAGVNLCQLIRHFDPCIATWCHLLVFVPVKTPGGLGSYIGRTTCWLREVDGELQVKLFV